MSINRSSYGEVKRGIIYTSKHQIELSCHALIYGMNFGSQYQWLVPIRATNIRCACIGMLIRRYTKS